MDAERDVLEVFDALDRAFEARDLAGVRMLWADDLDVTFWGSAEPEVAVGPDELATLFGLVVSTPGTFAIWWDARRVHVEGDAAWVTAAGVATWTRTPGDVVVLPYRLTGILVRRDGRWLWHTHHGSEPSPLDLSHSDPRRSGRPDEPGREGRVEP